MTDETLENRLATLEQTVQGQVNIHDLEAFQATLSAQILQLGAEMRAGFSAVGEEIRASSADTQRVLREEIRTGDEETRGFMEQRTAEILASVAAGDAETRRTLREEIRAGDEETRGFMEQRTAEILASVAAGDAETRRELGNEIRAGDKETRDHMRVLFEETIDRLRNARD